MILDPRTSDEALSPETHIYPYRFQEHRNSNHPHNPVHRYKLPRSLGKVLLPCGSDQIDGQRKHQDSSILHHMRRRSSKNLVLYSFSQYKFLVASFHLCYTRNYPRRDEASHIFHHTCEHMQSSELSCKRQVLWR